MLYGSFWCSDLTQFFSYISLFYHIPGSSVLDRWWEWGHLRRKQVHRIWCNTAGQQPQWTPRHHCVPWANSAVWCVLNLSRTAATTCFADSVTQQLLPNLWFVLKVSYKMLAITRYCCFSKQGPTGVTRKWRMEAVPSCACQLHKLTNIPLNSPACARRAKHSPQTACAADQARNHHFVTKLYIAGQAIICTVIFIFFFYVCTIHCLFLSFMIHHCWSSLVSVLTAVLKTSRAVYRKSKN